MKILKPFKRASTINVTQGYHAGHQAIDWQPSWVRGGYGTPLVAPEKSKVIRLYGNAYTPNDNKPLENGFGLAMEGLETGLEHLYWHTQPTMPVNVGDTVEKGQIVAYCGNSGNVYQGGQYVPLEHRYLDNKAGTHLHQEVRQNGVKIDPNTLIDWNVEPTYTIFDELKAITKTLWKISSLLK
jgi:murein DD-endopeptidase MepM/ murein hydrolase activator NlpD